MSTEVKIFLYGMLLATWWASLALLLTWLPGVHWEFRDAFLWMLTGGVVLHIARQEWDKKS